MGEVSTRDRFRGCLVGLAAGDALGTTLEFSPPGSFDPIDDMVGGGPFGLRAGQWTDDTSMALCLATSLLESGGFDPLDQMRRYLRWFREGYLSSTGECFDIGGTTMRSLEQSSAVGSISNESKEFGGYCIERLRRSRERNPASEDRTVDRNFVMGHVVPNRQDSFLVGEESAEFVLSPVTTLQEGAAQHDHAEAAPRKAIVYSCTEVISNPEFELIEPHASAASLEQFCQGPHRRGLVDGRVGNEEIPFSRRRASTDVAQWIRSSVFATESIFQCLHASCVLLARAPFFAFPFLLGLAESPNDLSLSSRDLGLEPGPCPLGGYRLRLILVGLAHLARCGRRRARFCRCAPAVRSPFPVLGHIRCRLRHLLA